MLNAAPNSLEDYVMLPEVGGIRIIYEGSFTLNSNGRGVSLCGRVYYSFAEKIEVLIEGEADLSLYDLPSGIVDLELGESYHGSLLIEVVSGNRLKGIVTRLESKISHPCDKWRWCYLNGPKIHGDMVRRGRGLAWDRLVFQDGGYEIIFENKERRDSQKRHREVSYYCELSRIDRSQISKEDALSEVLLFSRFVSFFNGCDYAPFFVEGLSREQVKYENHTLGPDSSLTGVSSWRPDLHDHDLLPLWKSFRSKRYESLDQYDVLNTAVHWYVQANMNRGRLEGAFILGFTGLELMSNEIVGKELDSNKVIIEDFMTRFRLDSKMDPEDIAQTRNYLTHYKNEHRRSTYNSLTFQEKVFRLEVVLQILELAILYWLDYKGHFADRLQQGRIKVVPWGG